MPPVSLGHRLEVRHEITELRYDKPGPAGHRKILLHPIEDGRKFVREHVRTGIGPMDETGAAIVHSPGLIVRKPVPGREGAQLLLGDGVVRFSAAQLFPFTYDVLPEGPAATL